MRKITLTRSLSATLLATSALLASAAAQACEDCGDDAAKPTAHAHAAAAALPSVQLSTQAQMEIDNDWLTVNLSATVQGADPVAVQNQLKHLTAQAQAELKKRAGANWVFHTGDFTVFPRYGNTGKVTGWQGQARIVVEGSDWVAVTQHAAAAPGFVVEGSRQSLSNTRREQFEAQVRDQAIRQYQAKAQAIAVSFGFKQYKLKEVQVNSDSGVVMMMAAPKAMRAAEASDAPIPVEVGKGQVTVTVSGTVSLER